MFEYRFHPMYTREQYVIIVVSSTDGINECLAGPCENDAECEDLSIGFGCVCREGFQGELCEGMMGIFFTIIS